MCILLQFKYSSAIFCSWGVCVVVPKGLRHPSIVRFDSVSVSVSVSGHSCGLCTRGDGLGTLEPPTHAHGEQQLFRSAVGLTVTLWLINAYPCVWQKFLFLFADGEWSRNKKLKYAKTKPTIFLTPLGHPLNPVQSPRSCHGYTETLVRVSFPNALHALGPCIASHSVVRCFGCPCIIGVHQLRFY